MSPSNRQLEVFIIGISLILVLAIPAAAHGNYLSADPQISQDGEIRIEGAFIVTNGYVVLHADDAGEIGEVVGFESVEPNSFHGSLTISIPDTYWANISSPTSLWVVLHYDGDGNNEFNPTEDPPIGGEEDPDHARQIHVEKGDHPAYVLVETEHAQRTNTSAVLIRDVYLPADGSIAVNTNAGNSPGDVVGQKHLAAGRHENVEVSIDDHYYHHQPEQFSLWAVLYSTASPDTNEELGTRIEVDGSPVASRFTVERADSEQPNHTHTASPTPTPPGTVSPTATPDSDSHDHTHEHTPTETPPVTTTPSPSPTSAPESPSPPSIASPTSTPGQPGFGFLTVVVTVTAIYLARRRKFA